MIHSDATRSLILLSHEFHSISISSTKADHHWHIFNSAAKFTINTETPGKEEQPNFYQSPETEFCIVNFSAY